jgi:hypothetical protein
MGTLEASPPGISIRRRKFSCLFRPATCEPVPCDGGSQRRARAESLGVEGVEDDWRPAVEKAPTLNPRRGLPTRFPILGAIGLPGLNAPSAGLIDESKDDDCAFNHDRALTLLSGWQAFKNLSRRKPLLSALSMSCQLCLWADCIAAAMAS